VALVLLARPSAAQTAENPCAPLPDANASAANENPWSFSAFAFTYFPPDSRAYVNPNLTVDYRWLHLEARYNYEALETGSTWVGCNFKVGDELAFAATPMVAGVFGELTGIALGATLSLTLGGIELSSQSEYVIAAKDRSRDFFYTWSELSYAPADWFRAGLAVQRTQVYKTDLDIQRGLLAGFSVEKVNLTAYVFNIGWTDPTVVLSGGATF